MEQNLSLVRRVADHAVVLDAGSVTHTGPALELLDDADRVRALLGVARTAADPRGGPGDPAPTGAPTAPGSPTRTTPAGTQGRRTT